MTAWLVVTGAVLVAWIVLGVWCVARELRASHTTEDR